MQVVVRVGKKRVADSGSFMLLVWSAALRGGPLEVIFNLKHSGQNDSIHWSGQVLLSRKTLKFEAGATSASPS